MTITALPAPPSRQDPVNFAARADEFMAALPDFVTETNDAAATVNAQQITAVSAASTATTKASEAASARDIVMAVVHYQGPWSTLSGALNTPASVLHSDIIWMLAENVANVAAETPGVSAKWINVSPASGLGTAAYASTSDFQPAIGALTGLLISAGGGTISAATAAQIVAAIGITYVANATYATSAGSANLATAIQDGAVSSAAKVANGILTGSKFAINTIQLDKIARTGSSGQFLQSFGAGADPAFSDLPTHAPVLLLRTNTTSGTAHEVTGIPSWVAEIDVILEGLSVSGTASVGVQIGAASFGYWNYYQGCASTVSTSASASEYTDTVAHFRMGDADTSAAYRFGKMTIKRALGSNTWELSGKCSLNTTIRQAITSCFAHFGTDVALDRVRLTTVGGTNTFTGGVLTIVGRG